MVGSIFDTLLRSSDDGKSIVGGLAESFKVSEDGTTVTLSLQDGLKFADGSTLDADDVLFSLDRARNPDLGPWAGMLSSVADVTADGNTITLSLSQPDPTILSMLATFNTAIVNKDVFDAAEGATDQEKSSVIFAAAGPGVGSGGVSTFASSNRAHPWNSAPTKTIGKWVQMARRCPILTVFTLKSYRMMQPAS